jgi:nucleotide-binding universal stress UspA family protein
MDQAPLIVLTTDFSQAAERAFQPTAALARSLGARIIVLHVLPGLENTPRGLPDLPRETEPGPEPEAEAARKSLNELRSHFGRDLRVDTKVLVGGHVADVITDFARREGAAFIALASHGRTGVRQLVFGSVAGAILRKSHTPIIVFPQSAPA